MRRAIGRWIALTAFLLGIGAWITALVLDSPPYTTIADRLWAVSFLAFPAVGLLLAVRVPRNPIGWMFIVGPGMIGLGVTIGEAGNERLGDNFFGPGVLVLLASLLLFPDGRYPGRLWMLLHVVVLAGVAIEPIVSPETDGGRAVGAAFALTVGALIRRLVGGDPTLRRQIALPVVVGVIGAAGATLDGFLSTPDWAGVAWVMLMTAGVPISIAVAILRYRLFDIDRIVSRTVSYAIVALAVGLIYVVPVLILPRFFGESSPLVVAISTLTAASAFNPLRRRILRAVDRRFNRIRYDSEREMDALTLRLRSAVTLDAVGHTLDEAVARTLQPVRSGLWIRSRH